MFDYAAESRSPRRFSKSRLATSLVSAIAHVTILVLLAIPALYATDALPTPPEMMAFVVAAPPPPPPPPPAVKRAAEPRKRAQPAPRPRPALEAKPAMPAPVEEPAAIADDIGLENTGTAVADLAGFEYGIEGGVVGGVVGGLETAPPPPPPDPPKPVRIGGNITPPRLVHRVNPEYPPIAQTAQIEGIVILEATVDTSGGVDEVRVLRSHPFLQQAAIRAVEQWRYEPLVLNGQPMPFVLTVTVSFSVD